MKKFLAAFILSAMSIQAICTENETTSTEPPIFCSFSYGTIGAGPIPLPAPNLGIGRRLVFKKNRAIDINLNGSSAIILNTLQGSINMLWYFKQEYSSQYYFGLGGGLGFCLGFSANFYPTPVLTFGKEFFNSKNYKRFFQGELAFPLLTLDSGKTQPFPFLVLKYGIAF